MQGTEAGAKRDSLNSSQRQDNLAEEMAVKIIEHSGIDHFGGRRKGGVYYLGLTQTGKELILMPTLPRPQLLLEYTKFFYIFISYFYVKS